MKITSLSKPLTLISAVVAIGAMPSCVAPVADTTVSVNPTTGAKVYPIAKPVLDANGQPVKDRFISPYRPYNPINTKGYKSGDVVGDPSTAGVSKKTGKPVLSTSKAFRIPSLAPAKPAATN